MFQQLETLVRATGKLQLTLKMDNDRMAVVVVPQGDGKEAALRQPLVLTATPAELDEGFAAAVSSYASVHASLSEQVAATTAILQEAEKSLVSTARKSLSKGGKAAAKDRQTDGGDDDEVDGADGSVDMSTSATETRESAAPADANQQSGTDLFSLIS